MPNANGNLLLSRRSLVCALGGAAIAGLHGCGGGTGGTGGTGGAAGTGGTGGAAGTGGSPGTGGSLGTGGSFAKVADGYADQLSCRPGDPVTLFLNGSSSGRASLGLYDLMGRRVFEFPADLATQSAVGSNPWETGFGYQATASVTIPDLPSGVYLVERLIPLIVKTAPEARADVVILYSTNTEAAYNSTGGRSMYSQPERAPIVSFRRPLERSLSRFSDSFLQWIAGLDLPYSFRYVADMDLEDYSEISGAKLLVVTGHSEYWTRRAREHFDRFVLEGGNALLLSGNTMWWQVRYSDDRSQMICYKGAPDPVADPLLRTLNWPDPLLDYPVVPSIGADFPRGGYGNDSRDVGWDGFRVLLPESPVFRGVAVQRGDVISIPSVEYDGAPLQNLPVTRGEPQLDLNTLGSYRAQIIGYDYGYRGGADTVGTWLALQRTGTSGIVMNGASTDWCSTNGVGGSDRVRVRQIILNMIEILTTRQPVFVS